MRRVNLLCRPWKRSRGFYSDVDRLEHYLRSYYGLHPPPSIHAPWDRHARSYYFRNQSLVKSRWWRGDKSGANARGSRRNGRPRSIVMCRCMNDGEWGWRMDVRFGRRYLNSYLSIKFIGPPSMFKSPSMLVIENPSGLWILPEEGLRAEEKEPVLLVFDIGNSVSDWLFKKLFPREISVWNCRVVRIGLILLTNYWCCSCVVGQDGSEEKFPFVCINQITSLDITVLVLASG